jgi:hypothetical protein
MTQGATIPVLFRPAISVWLVRYPNGALPNKRVPLRQRHPHSFSLSRYIRLYLMQQELCLTSDRQRDLA